MDGQPMWKERGADTFNPFSSGNSLLLELFLANSTSGNESGSSIMINDNYFESTGTVITCKKACKGTAYVRHIRPAITGTGSGNITVNLLQNDVKILSKTYTTIGTETISFECAVGDVLTINGNTNHVTCGVGTVYILFIAE